MRTKLRIIMLYNKQIFTLLLICSVHNYSKDVVKYIIIKHLITEKDLLFGIIFFGNVKHLTIIASIRSHKNNFLSNFNNRMNSKIGFH